MPNKPNNEVSSGWFIRFTPDEKDDENCLIQFLEENGYLPAPEGIKELLLDTIYEEETERKKNPILEALNEHPEAVQETLKGLGNLASSLLNKKLFKKK